MSRTMPRISLRRILFYLSVSTVISLLVLNLPFGGVPDIPQEVLKYPRNALPRPTPSGDIDERHPPPQKRRSKEEVAISDVDIIDVGGLVQFPNKPWFMKGGQARPEPAPVDHVTNHRKARLFPHESDGDRIVDQLMFVPPNYPTADQRNGTKLKKILLYHGIHNWIPLKIGQETFLKDQCPVDTCEVTVDKAEAEVADAILFRDHVNHNPLENFARPHGQVWILYLLECPYHTESFPYKNLFNWTATYRHDSDIVAPYEKFVSYGTQQQPIVPVRNHAVNKTKKVAWFVSNCAAQNGRIKYAEQLAQYISVDIFGACGQLQCPRTSSKCFNLLNRDYKFYLSFENSNCKDYITEKFFVNGLGNDVLPIVMGARQEDYKRASPPHSFIHVDDFESPKELASYLHVLDHNDTLYNEYFRWKSTGEFVNTYFWCRVCAMLHDRHTANVYEDINRWWRGPGTCVNRRWNGQTLPSLPRKADVEANSPWNIRKQ